MLGMFGNQFTGYHHLFASASLGLKSSEINPARPQLGVSSSFCFREIVKAVSKSTVSNIFQGHEYKWENTNNLLKENRDNCVYTGVKTGITPTAGPCLAASCKKDDYHVVVIVL